MDDLFVRHTYLTAVIGIVVQASFGSDIYQLAETNPADLLHGRDFRNKTGSMARIGSPMFVSAALFSLCVVIRIRVPLWPILFEATFDLWPLLVGIFPCHYDVEAGVESVFL